MAQLERRLGSGSYDLAIVDAPATGHGLAMLRAPKTYADIARVGPIHRQATRIHSFVSDPACTAVVAVALPEEMPVNETLDLGDRLRDEMGMGLDAVVVNALYPERFSDDEAERLASLDGAGSEAQRAALEAALSEHRRARAQRAELRRLESETEAPVTTLPYLFQPDLGFEQLERLSRELEGAL